VNLIVTGRKGSTNYKQAGRKHKEQATRTNKPAQDNKHREAKNMGTNKGE